MSKSHIREMRSKREMHSRAMRQASTTIAGFRPVCAHCHASFAYPVCCQRAGQVDRSMPVASRQDELKTFAGDTNV